MSALISELISSILQIIIFSLIPFLYWFLTARKQSKFFSWIGLTWKKEENHRNLFFWITGSILGFWLIGEFSLYALKDVTTATSEFSGLGFAAIPAIILYAILHTALSEEILFRGFLLKRLSGKFGFPVGNTIQALLFGLLHGLIFLSDAGYAKSILLISFTAGIAWFMGYINEKKSNGSIFPSWIIHGITNIISGLSAAF